MRQSQRKLFYTKKNPQNQRLYPKPVPSKAPVKKDDGEDEALVDDWEKMALDDDAPVADDWALADEGDEEGREGRRRSWGRRRYYC